jgi:peptidoglycan DL-endopeptidase LytE
MKRQLMTIAAAAGILMSSIPGVASANGDTYTVKSGDTLWKISQANHITIHQLVDWNELNTSEIRVGQSLFITNPQQDTYTVKSGDVLWKIAANHHLTIAQLKSYNGLTTDSIYVNQVLQLKPNGNVKTASTVDNLIVEAKKYIGVPYQWGGSTPTAFDCSGYLNYVYNNVGISIPRTVATIWNATKAVSSPNVGDIVFYNTSGSGASHAGIYLGNNQFIHAGTSTGVTISDMNSNYWKSRYLGARTPF